MEMPEIDVDELERHLAEGARLYDVREPGEWVAARIDGAINVPLATVPDALAEFPTDSTVFVNCGKGGRSAQAVQFLRTKGVDAINVAGGMHAWLDAGKPAIAGA